MNRCDHGIWGLYPTSSVIQTWGAPQTKYRSLYDDYVPDPVATKTVQLWDTRKWESKYSSRKKAFYPIVPHNTQTFSYAPVVGRFDHTRLKQTNVLNLIRSRSLPLSQFGRVSLAHTLSPLVHKMGLVEDLATGQNLGTGTLIAENLVLVARHSVEGRNIRNLNVTFGYTEFNGSFYNAGQTRFDRVIEESASCDYAILQLQESLGKHLGYVYLHTKAQMAAEPALLHYPLGKPLSVSVHTFNQTLYQTDYLVAYHDSDYFSSGGAYFDPAGRMVALHLGAELEGGTMNLLRYALPLERIARQNPHSLLQKFAQGELSQANSYTTNSCRVFLAPTNHRFLIDEEGRESEKILRGLLEKELKKDKNIKRNKNGTISFSVPNLKYIETTYPQKFQTFRKRCLGVTGLHKFTHLYSVKRVIESDHTIPHAVWKSTTNPKMKTLVQRGGGKRKGEYDMPAITLPWGIHRNLLTTGGVPGYRSFHQLLIRLCDQDRIDDALIACYQEYKKKGLNLQAYKGRITKSIADHINLGLITKVQAKKIYRTVF